MVNEWVARRRCSRDLKGSGQGLCRGSGTKSSSCSKEKQRGTSCSSSSQPQRSQSCRTNSQTSSPPLSSGSTPDFESINQASSSTIEENPIPNNSPPPGMNTPSTDTKQECNLEHDKDLPPADPSPPSLESSQLPQTSPCKLLTRLTTNPTSDISNILAAPAPEPDSTTTTAEDGLPCESAYKLLMRYATSDEKLDALARTLESGCVPNSKGGCKVRNETVSQALLDICL